MRNGVLDEVLGIRGWWLILYGILPANLSLLGLGTKIDFSENLEKFVLVLLLLIPFFIGYQYTSKKFRSWYLTKKRHHIRCAIITVIILVLSTLICSISVDECGTKKIWQSLALGIATMSVSSGYLSLSKGWSNELMGVPSPFFVNALDEVKKNLIGFLKVNFSMEGKCPKDDDLKRMHQYIRITIENLENMIEVKAPWYSGFNRGWFSRDKFQDLKMKLRALEETFDDILKLQKDKRENKWNSCKLGISEARIQIELLMIWNHVH